jgi:hypothetical protein
MTKSFFFFTKRFEFGIHGLMKLLSEECPEAIKEHQVFLKY